MNNLIFGTDGIRGVANQQLSANLVFSIGKALGVKIASLPIKQNKVIIAQDTRMSSDMLFSAISAGLMSMGVDIIDIGIATTPALSYLAKHTNSDFGIMITASHNSAEYNGLKFFDAKGYKISSDTEKEIQSILDNIDSYIPSSNIGKITSSHEILYMYIDNILNQFNNIDLKGKSIVIDCANGAGSVIIPRVYKTLFDKCECINCKMSGENINGNCGSVNADMFGASIIGKYDIGFAFDGDADRLVMVLGDSGRVLSGEMLLYIIAYYYKLKGKLKSNKVVSTILTNIGVEESLQKYGIEMLRCDVGDKNVTDTMLQHNLNLGAEESGHIILSDYGPTSDALVSSLVLLSIMQDVDINKLLQEIKLYDTIKLNLPVTQRQKQLILNGIINDYVATLDNELGDNARMIVRPSGTESVIRILLEGKNIDLMRNIADKVKECISNI